MDSDRRSFLKSLAVALATLPVFGRLAIPDSARAADADAVELPLLKETEDQAKAQKYCANADKPTKSCAARKSKDRAKQYCYNCQLFTRLEGDKKTGRGKCMIMLKNRVNANAWCMSWIENPAVKDGA